MIADYHAVNKRALIMDAHVGCQLWQKAAMEKSGVATTVLTFRTRRKPVVFPLTSAEKKIQGTMQWLWKHTWRRGSWSKTDSVLLSLACNTRDLTELFGTHDIFVGSYPPTIGRLLLDLGRRYHKRVILNLANRFTQKKLFLGGGGVSNTFTGILRALHESPEHTLAVMGEYDYQYIRHYLGMEPVKLYTSCHHLPLRRHTPTCDTVLVGPSGGPVSRGGIAPFRSAEEINDLYARWCTRNGTRKTVTFGHIRDLYASYELEDLAKHPAIVILPYSAYSISMAELYEMNIPFFVPSVDWMLQHQMPSEVMAHRYEGPPHPNSRIPYGFHDSKQAMAYWLRFCYVYQVEHAMVWDSTDDLFRKLTEVNLQNLSENMYRENKARREASLRRWAEVLQ